MKWFLLFEANCSTCNQLARAIEEAGAGKLEAISIHDAQAKVLLEQAFPEDWKYAPYLVAVDQGKIRAWTGLSSALRLVGLLGPRKAWCI